MSFSGALSPAERLSLSLDGLARAVAGRIVSRVMSAVMILLVWRRVKRVEREILGLLARLAAGRLRVVAMPRSGGGGGGARSADVRLPRGFAWLLPLVPCDAACFAGQIRTVLAEPEMVELLRVSPQARRVLRPLCRMLGIEGAVIGDVPVAGASVAGGSVGEVAPVARVRPKRAPVDLGRVPLPRGVLAAARRQGFGRR